MPGKLSRSNLDLPSNMYDVIMNYLKGNPTAMFRLPDIRDAYAMMRLDMISKDDIQVSNNVDAGAIENVIDYNFDMLQNMKNHQHTLKRPDYLIHVLKSIYYISLNRAKLKVLCIGPRTEAEFFTFIGEGFSPENLTGLDLMSYSEFVDVGDMHHMPYKADTFDIVFVGWTLTYSKDLQRVADECIRVAKPGGYVALGVESSGIAPQALYGHTLTDAINIQSTDEIVDLFEGHVHAVPFRHEVHRSMKEAVDMVMTIIELK